MSRRAFDIACAALGLILSGPAWPLIAAFIWRESGRPILHKTVRVGRFGEPITVFKFRSMTEGASGSGPAITSAGDPRVTRVGAVLRATKLDELPQLVNVLKGDMSIVGPRPEDPRYVETYTGDDRQILRHKPGITSPATVAFRHEEKILAASDDPELTYRTSVLPEKLAIDRAALSARSVAGDVKIIVATVRAIIQRHTAPSDGA